MTQPGLREASVVPAVIWAHADEALSLEEDAARQVAGPLRSQLGELIARFGRRWTSTFGSFRTQASGREFARFMGDLATELYALRFNPYATLLDYAQRALRLGQEQAWREVGRKPGELVGDVDTATRNSITAAADTAGARLRTAGALTIQPKGSFTTVTRALAPAQAAATLVERTARTVTNEQLNVGSSLVTHQLGGRELWVAERDACVHCLALSGHLIGPDGVFDANLTFGSSPLAWEPAGGLTGPPRHPNCRCRVTPWLGTGMGLPDALRREAERSVLKGWARPSEPDSVRTQAADRLLTRIADGHAPSGWQVPASVRTQTERRLDKGTFGATPTPQITR